MDCANYAETTTDNNDASPSSTGIDYLPLDDTEFPYAGIPRIVIETESNRAIKDRETEIPAKLQIWGEKAPESEVLDLTIRGRGNSSWLYMPKKSYKIEFVNKQEMLGMPKDRDWALIANYADKTLMKNYLMYHLSAELDLLYTPRCEFVELFLNKEYLGTYLLTETIKVGKNRINIPKNNETYLVESDGKYKESDQVVFSDIIPSGLKTNAFTIHEPKNASKEVLLKIENHIKSFETFLTKINPQIENNLNQWIDIDDYIKYYWIQEFSKNPDGVFSTSVYFTWKTEDVIRMGPVWDFDISCGGHNDASRIFPEDWYIKNYSWNFYAFKDSVLMQARVNFWDENKNKFEQTLNTIDSIHVLLNKSAKNNFKKWNILQNTDLVYHHYAYNSYEEAVKDLKEWIAQRLIWINTQIK